MYKYLKIWKIYWKFESKASKKFMPAYQKMKREKLWKNDNGSLIFQNSELFLTLRNIKWSQLMNFISHISNVQKGKVNHFRE